MHVIAVRELSTWTLWAVEIAVRTTSPHIVLAGANLLRWLIAVLVLVVVGGLLVRNGKKRGRRGR